MVIGGGYATGRELAEFFLPSGPQGGLMAIVLAMLIWSVVCAVTFSLAYATKSWNYRAFFKNLLGPFWVIFEICYLLFIILILAVFGAAAGAIGAALMGWPPLVGTLLPHRLHQFRHRLRHDFGGASVQVGLDFPVRRVRHIRRAVVLRLRRSNPGEFGGAGAA